MQAWGQGMDLGPESGVGQEQGRPCQLTLSVQEESMPSAAVVLYRGRQVLEVPE